ncbi:hypothetical protein [Ferruginibacter sp. HRS2-29]|uniref:hypothetical protein n=1 Tax=Ferruginibacter sp. HRS2-29 TaxID=2487334 RepID=UPI0020CE45C4|nr:hypothetical protein [Ferruginibacter sp. HRS2-29]MCP9752766.1 hypothetical protein [Ferruginibacter sp. HRS2-29]
MKINKLALGILAGAALVAASMVLAKNRRKKVSRMLSEVAEEGYETAHDILYPGKGKKEKNLRYGPVLPI